MLPQMAVSLYNAPTMATLSDGHRPVKWDIVLNRILSYLALGGVIQGEHTVIVARFGLDGGGQRVGELP